MKKLLVAAAAVLCLSAAPALACTAQDIQAKVQEITTKLQALAQSNPQKAQEVSQKLQAISQRMAEAASKGQSDLTEICKGYDEMIAELNK
jgi:uncharacterized protein YoxC